jgi:hypothetical protein
MLECSLPAQEPKKGVDLRSFATAVYTDQRLVGSHNPEPENLARSL